MSTNNQPKVLLQLQHLKKYFPIKKKSIFQREQHFVHANEDITLDIYEGETLGLVGESGSGKSTLGRTIVQLHQQTAGSTLYFGNTLSEIAPKYVKKILKTFAKVIPNYFKEEKELNELIKLANQQSDLNEKKRQEDVIAHKKRQMNNKYLNYLRIGGGLVVSDELTLVADSLLKVYNNQVQLAKLKLQISEAKSDLKDTVKETQKEKLQAKLNDLNAQIKAIEPILAKAEMTLQALHEKHASLDRYAEFEAMRSVGVDLSKLTNEEMRLLRKDIQIIFQDPYSSLNPRLTVGQIIGEGILAHGMFKSAKSPGYNEYIQQIMKQCGLAPYFIHRYPHQFSGGQRQRIGIARALALKPKFVVCDEAVSALDVSIQSQIINLLRDLKEELNLTYLFITHDLSVVKYISDRIAVMYLGYIVELSDTKSLFDKPLHPYTQALLEAIPRTDVDGRTYELQILEGDIPSAVHPPKGCRFNTRCKHAFDMCFEIDPQLKEIEPNHFVSCHLVDQKYPA